MSQLVNMKQEDKIYDLFRKNQHKLEEMPSPQSWEKLRNRLEDRRHTRPQLSIYRTFAMVAAAVGLVLIITTVFNPSTSVQKQAYKMEEIPNYPPEILQKAVEAHRYRIDHHQALQEGIGEGEPTSLIVNKKASRPFLLPRKKETI